MKYILSVNIIFTDTTGIEKKVPIVFFSSFLEDVFPLLFFLITKSIIFFSFLFKRSFLMKMNLQCTCLVRHRALMAQNSAQFFQGIIDLP